MPILSHASLQLDTLSRFEIFTQFQGGFQALLRVTMVVMLEWSDMKMSCESVENQTSLCALKIDSANSQYSQIFLGPTTPNTVIQPLC